MSVNNTTKWQVSLLVGVVTISIFILDLTLPLGVAQGVFYIIPVLITFWLNSRKITWGVVLISILLIVVGFLFSPSGGEFWKVLFNRSLSFVSVIVSGIMVTKYLAKNQALKESVFKSERLVKALKESQEQYVTVVENSFDVISVFNSSGHITYMSPNVGLLFGYTVKELIGTSLIDYVHIEDKELIQELLSFTIGEKSLKYRFLQKNGETHDVETIFKSLTREGEQIIIGTTRVITEEKIVQDRLIKSENSLKEAQKVSKVGNWSLDIINNKLDWSDQIYRLFNLKPQEFKATYEAFLDAIHPDDRDMVNEAYQNSLIDKTPYEIVHRLLLKDGIIKYVFEKCSTAFNEKGEAINSVGTIQDITELQVASNELSKSLEEKEILLKEVHHRVKNNLQIISGLLEMQSYRTKSEVVKSELAESKSRIKSIALMHEQLYQSSDMSNVDLCSYVVKLFNEIHSTFHLREREIEFNVNIEDVFLDINKAIPVGLILNELVTNSVKHAFVESSDDNKILIEAKEEADELFLTLTDNGVGMNESMEEIEKKSLGVKIIKALVGQLNGEYSIDSNSNGTTVKLNIPVNE